MKRVRIPKFRYKPRHRGGWFRGYDGPVKPEPEQHEGATATSPLPSAEVAAVGEDPLLSEQIKIHHEVSVEALEEERHRLELAEIRVRTRAELDAIFAPMQTRLDDVFDPLFDRLQQIPLAPGWCKRLYLDAVRRAAEAERFARELATGELALVA